MRPFLLAAAAVALAGSAQAQQAPARVAAHAGSVYVVPHGAGEPVRVTTYAHRPSTAERLARYRGVRVFRGGALPAAVVRATPVMPVAASPDGRFVRRGGTSYPVAPR